MAATTMFHRSLNIDGAPGSIPPVIYLKQGTNSGSITVFIEIGEGYSTTAEHFCIIKGTRPDGSELYIEATTGGWSNTLRVSITRSYLKQISEVAGKYLMEITIFNSSNKISRRNVSGYDTITTAKVYVDVIACAYREEDA